MGDTTAHDSLPWSEIPVHFYVLSGLVVASLLGTQLLGLCLTGFRKPVPVREGFDPMTGKMVR
jgi:hypothetical protein